MKTIHKTTIDHFLRCKLEVGVHDFLLTSEITKESKYVMAEAIAVVHVCEEEKNECYSLDIPLSIKIGTEIGSGFYENGDQPSVVLHEMGVNVDLSKCNQLNSPMLDDLNITLVEHLAINQDGNELFETIRELVEIEIAMISTEF